MSACPAHQSQLYHADGSNTCSKWIVVGLTGVTGAGKTTLAQSLLSVLPTTTVYISQDEYILPNDYPNHPKAPEEIGGLNKETLLSINMDKMLADLKTILVSYPATIPLMDCSMQLPREKVIGSALQNPRPPPVGYFQKCKLPAVLLVDGHLLFNHPEVPPLCHLRFCLTLTKEACWDRRNKKTFTTSGMNSQQYFDKCVWPTYQEHFTQMCNSITEIHFLDGTAPKQATCDRVLRDVMQLVESSD